MKGWQKTFDIFVSVPSSELFLNQSEILERLTFYIFLITPYTRDATFLFTSQITNNLTRRVREWIVVS